MDRFAFDWLDDLVTGAELPRISHGPSRYQLSLVDRATGRHGHAGQLCPSLDSQEWSALAGDRFIVVTQRRSRRHYVVVEPVCAWILGFSLSRQMVADLRSRACAVWCLRSPPSRSSQEELCARLGGDRMVNLVALFTDRHDALDPHPAIGADKLDRSRPARCMVRCDRCFSGPGDAQLQLDIERPGVAGGAMDVPKLVHAVASIWSGMVGLD